VGADRSTVGAASAVRAGTSPDPAGGTLRLFVALELPESVRTAVGAWAAAELGAIDSLRPVRVEGLHVTLCFLGSTAVGELDSISACCGAACAGHGPLRLSFGELLALPRRRPRAIAVRVGDKGGGHGQRTGLTELTELTELQSSLAGALAAGGWYRPEARPFLAHVTVARVRSGMRLDARALQERVNRLPTTFTADVVTLFESRTQPGGAVYQPRAQIELAA
jgi:RNA 2',3'-cyclic 3'-phosphodiesterase